MEYLPSCLEIDESDEHLNLDNDSNTNKDFLEHLHLLKAKEHEHMSPDEEQTISVNIGNPDETKEVRIGSSLNSQERDEMLELLREYIDVFAWSYADMPGIDPDIVMHEIPTLPEFKPVKQKLRKLVPEWSLKIKAEITKQLNVGFLKVIEYPTWLANIVPVPKKGGDVRMCVDFRDLNKACPKDDFPLPNIDMLVDNTANHALKSFVDGFAGYNQIKMHPDHQEKTAFITPWGTFCYTVMAFGLKNAGATFQRASTTLLHDMIHKEVEVYVDDMIIKSRDREGHVPALRKFFHRIRQYQMRLNPQKCVFGVTKGKVLGFMVSQEGIEVDPAKVKAILEMPPPRTEKEIRGFLGRLQFISRFISQLTMTCEPIFKLLKKDAIKEWNPHCQEAFDKIKEYLTHPPVLMPPRPHIPLLLYLTVTDTAAGAMLAQYMEESRKERAIYYVSRKLVVSELNYSALEKACVSLVWVTQRLRHYMLAFSIQLISRMDPLKYLFERPALSSRMAKWLLLLTEFEITYVTQKSIKGKAIADYLADNPIEEDSQVAEFPDEAIFGIENDRRWRMYFDGAANKRGFGIGMLLISPNAAHSPTAIKLSFECTNNMTEYEACITGLEIALEKGIEELEVYGDSILVISQILGRWNVKDEKLLPYHDYLERVASRFRHLEFFYLPRVKNSFADALATLASMIEVPDGTTEITFTIQSRDVPAYCFEITGIEGDVTHSEVWYFDIWNLMKGGSYPLGATPNDRMALRRLAAQFIICGGQLYKRGFDGIHLRCVAGQEIIDIMEKIHGGECGPHMSGHTLSRKILRQSYYWSTMQKDCAEYVKRCLKCQQFAPRQHLPPRELYCMTSPWPFSTWGIDIIGKVTPKSSSGHEFILVAIDYFTKWVEAESYAVLNAKKVAKFIRRNIICRFGVPHEFVSDNGSHFEKEVADLLDEYGIVRHKSSPYRPQTNGAVEAANKNIKAIISKTTETCRDWSDKLPYALWGYRTTERTSIGSTPFSLVYGMEAVLPVELEIPSLRVLLETQVSEVDWVQARYDELALLDERRLRAAYHHQGYQQRIARAFNKKIKERNIQEGDLVLKENLKPSRVPGGKFAPNWGGPYQVIKIKTGGAAFLADLDGIEFTQPCNIDRLKRFYP